ncbi:MAG: M50 family metallopeptidase [Verrucomicrobiota bacterium]|jgi:Zn-dependent protease|nr:M50 family metallopeptidase [Chthoniobacterales bacterium]MDQ3313358.1 M50 family metallopeptidase [Verrucomicrobiota bacterium]
MQSGSIPLFRLAGIRVFLHFSWFIVGAYEISVLRGRYHAPIWAVYEYLALFLIVLLHEFGHALACRQVGGHAEQIVLWPLGGIAFVSPPPRASAMLWSIAAGPLVNVVLAPFLEILLIFARAHWRYEAPDAVTLIYWIRVINLALLVFNLLPVYPLDGGQILRALLWFPLGRIRSLQIASALGVAGGALLGAYAYYLGSIWIGVMAFFLVSRAVAGWRQASELAAEERETHRALAAMRERPVL